MHRIFFYIIKLLINIFSQNFESLILPMSKMTTFFSEVKPERVCKINSAKLIY